MRRRRKQWKLVGPGQNGRYSRPAVLRIRETCPARRDQAAAAPWGQAALGDPGGGLLQGVLAQGEELLMGVGPVYHVGEVLHLIGPEHGDDGPPGGEVLIDPGGDHVAVRLLLPEEVQQHPGTGTGAPAPPSGGREGENAHWEAGPAGAGAGCAPGGPEGERSSEVAPGRRRAGETGPDPRGWSRAQPSTGASGRGRLGAAIRENRG